MNWLEEGNTSKIPNLLSQEPRYVYKTFLFYSSRNFSLRRKKERKKEETKTDRFFDPAGNLRLAGKMKRRGKKDGGNIRDEKNLMSVNSPSAADARANAGKNSFLRR